MQVASWNIGQDFRLPIKRLMVRRQSKDHHIAEDRSCCHSTRCPTGFPPPVRPSSRPFDSRSDIRNSQAQDALEGCIEVQGLTHHQQQAAVPWREERDEPVLAGF